MKRAPRILVIPDTQLRPDVPTSHIKWVARYAAEKQPDAIVQIGDWYDLASLSRYDRGRKRSEGRRLRADVSTGNGALAMFEKELERHSARRYKPRRKVWTRGNHEGRIDEETEANAYLDGSLPSFDFKKHGWEDCEFLRPVNVMGITFMHYCPLNAQGQVTNGKHGAPSALAQARRMMRSTVCGHKQGLDTAVVHTPGRTIRGVIAGSFYQHSEHYLTACGDTYWRGVLVLNDVRDGTFDLCEVSLDFLRRKYG